MKNTIITFLFILGIQLLNAQTFTYDNLNRITSMVCADGKYIQYEYDAVGNRTQTVVLPAELVSFKAKPHPDGSIQSLLEWSTASEENTTVFEIEHTIDGITFTKVGEVNAVGNSASRLDYRFVHTSPKIGINYYRLKIVDLGGTYSYSAIRSVKFEKKMEITTLFPNPTNNILNVDFFTLEDIDHEDISIEVFDKLGRKVGFEILSQEENQIRIRFDGQAAGIYTLHLKYIETKISKKFMIAK